MNVSDLISEALDKEFEELFHELYPMAYRTAYGVVGNSQDAEDVAQTIFLKLLRKIWGQTPNSFFQPRPCSLGTWNGAVAAQKSRYSSPLRSAPCSTKTTFEFVPADFGLYIQTLTFEFPASLRGSAQMYFFQMGSLPRQIPSETIQEIGLA